MGEKEKDEVRDFQDAMECGLDPFNPDPVMLMVFREKRFQEFKKRQAIEEREERRNRNAVYRLPCPTRWQLTQFCLDRRTVPKFALYEPFDPTLLLPQFRGIDRLLRNIAVTREPPPPRPIVPKRIKKALQWKKKN